MESSELRIILVVLGVLLLAAIYFFGRPRKPDQGKRTGLRRSGGRVDPVLADGDAEAVPELTEEAMQSELELLERTLGDLAPEGAAPRAPSEERPGARAGDGYERIVTLFVAARDGEMLHGSDIVVAAEKAGLLFGHMNIFHRMVDGHPEQGPIFSVANMVKPGNFDMGRISTLQTPGLSLFMTLPGPLPALDAWETMLPASQRLAELLDAVVLDEQRNALGRQRIAHIRDQLRAWDRKREQQQIRTNW